ncbi:hypothetical protein [Actinacidiphila yeochonensis]|uniref:hypothetical protein n=1 Tax=Actinacidiphila yeochonensis TaxID=89050 RepID=UPI000AA87CB2|nr:hypothetical protein [Actinacidiphila yeochonensis]
MIPELSTRGAFLVVAVVTGVMALLTLTAQFIGVGQLLLCLAAAVSPGQLTRS